LQVFQQQNYIQSTFILEAITTTKEENKLLD